MTNANGNASLLVIMTISMLVAVIKTEHIINVKGSWDSSRVPPTLTCQRAAYHKAFIKNESFNKWFIHKCIERKSLTNIWGIRHQCYLFFTLISLNGEQANMSLDLCPLFHWGYTQENISVLFLHIKCYLIKVISLFKL